MTPALARLVSSRLGVVRGAGLLSVSRTFTSPRLTHQLLARVANMSTAIDVDKVRSDTPGCRKGLVHLNNAGAALMPSCVLEAQKSYLDLEAQMGGYEAHDASMEQYKAVYKSIAKLINCNADEVACCENATRAWDAAFFALADSFTAGDVVVTGKAEYASNFIPFLQMQRRKGIKIHVVPNDPSGQYDVAQLETFLEGPEGGAVRLISLCHIPTNSGLINPAQEVGALARKHGIPFLLDACQSAGQIPLDVQTIQCDALSATSRKFLRGPRGVGFLYVRANSAFAKAEPVMLDLHSASWSGVGEYEVCPTARRYENWERNHAAWLGLGAAVDYALALGLPAISQRLCALASALRTKLSSIPGVEVLDQGASLGGLVTFCLPAAGTGGDLKTKLNQLGFHVSVSDAQSTLLDMTDRGLQEVVRASPHYFNTEEEIGMFAEAIARLAQE
eukprot:m.83567 g.83567  ORF g.83567 m.83567 type:complete len:448 (-) comp14770_c0_seq1:149-1492(-)